MVKFESVGMEKQYASASIQEAVFHYEESCRLCCMHGYHINCTQCHIAGAHTEITDYLKSCK